jgi:hypothetical protein
MNHKYLHTFQLPFRMQYVYIWQQKNHSKHISVVEIGNNTPLLHHSSNVLVLLIGDPLIILIIYLILFIYVFFFIVELVTVPYSCHNQLPI